MTKMTYGTLGSDSYWDNNGQKKGELKSIFISRGVNKLSRLELDLFSSSRAELIELRAFIIRFLLPILRRSITPLPLSQTGRAPRVIIATTRKQNLLQLHLRSLLYLQTQVGIHYATFILQENVIISKFSHVLSYVK